ncbi:Ankyrin repeats (3 copies) [seawater metagenome]|uniref:Ankyrin repeats (3 copies) n=1 Tax=seawater metagenome TaxID=1561972 RepID=A0A5E8CLN1_9ZZZZ
MSYKFPDRTMVPDRQINSQNIDSLFATVSTLNINDISNLTAETNLSYNETNKNGQTVLHIIIGLDDRNKKEHQRLNLVRFFVQNNVDVDAPDVNNITPLHLACKKQYYLIAQYLIQNGADSNSLNSSLMTPLHYTVQGYNQICYNTRIVGSLIPNPEPDKVNKLQELANVKKKIGDVLYQETDMNAFISNMVYTIKASPEYDLDNKINENLIELKKNISGVFNQRMKSTSDMEKSIQQFIYATIEKVKERIMNMNKFALRDVKFEISENPEGWGLDEFGITKILETDPQLKLDELWKLEKREVPSQGQINNYFDKLESVYEEYDLSIDQFYKIINNLRIYLNYYVFAGQNEDNTLANAQAQVDANLIPFFDAGNQQSLRNTENQLISDNILRHDMSLSFRDSIIDLENKLYLQGFHDYTIMDGLRDFPDVFAYINQAVPLTNEYAILTYLVCLILGLPNNIATAISDNFINNPNNIPNDVGNIGNYYNNVVAQPALLNNFDHGLIILVLISAIDQLGMDALKLLSSNYIQTLQNFGQQINPELEWHFYQLLDKNIDIKLMVMSLIQVNLRIQVNNNFTYFFKVLMDSISEWQKSSDINKLKLVISNGNKYQYVQINSNNNGLAPNNNIPNYPSQILTTIFCILLNYPNNQMANIFANNLPAIANELVYNIGPPPNLINIRNYISNTLLPTIQAIPAAIPINSIRPIIYLNYFIFGNSLGGNRLSMDIVLDFLDTLNTLPVALTAPENELLQNAINSIENQNSPIELLIHMCKYYFLKTPGLPSQPNIYHLDFLITYLRNIYYNNMGFNTIENFKDITSASFPLYDKIGFGVNIESSGQRAGALITGTPTVSSVTVKLLSLLINPLFFEDPARDDDNIFQVFRNIMPLVGNVLDLGQNNNPDWVNINGVGNNINVVIGNNQNLFVLFYLAACISSNNIMVKNYQTLINNTNRLIAEFNALGGVLISPEILNIFTMSYQATQDLVISFITVLRKFGLNNNGCLIMQETLYRCQQPNYPIPQELAIEINNCLCANILELEYLGKVNQIDEFVEREYQLRIGNNQRYMAYRQQNGAANPIEGSFWLGQFLTDGVIAAGFVNPPTPGDYWNLGAAPGTYPSPSFLSSLETAILSRISRQVLVAKKIIQSDRSGATLQVINNILDNKKLGYDYFENMLEGNFLTLFTLLQNTNILNKILNKENQYINRQAKKYVENVIELSNSYGRTDVITQAVLSQQKLIPNMGNEISEAEKNIQDLNNSNNSLIEIFNNLNGYNYINYVLNMPPGLAPPNVNNNMININKFVDGYYRILNGLKSIIPTSIYNDGNINYPPALNSPLVNLPNPGNNISMAYSGLPTDLSLYPDLNTKLKRVQGIVYNNNIVYSDNRRNKASSAISNPKIGDIYLYMIKEHLIKLLIKYTDQNRAVINTPSQDIYNEIQNYMDEVGINIEANQENPYKSVIIGSMANELLTNYLKMIIKKYAGQIVIKYINRNVVLQDDIGPNIIAGINEFVVADIADEFTTTLNQPSSRLINLIEANTPPADWSLLSFDPILTRKFEEIKQNFIYNNDYSSQETETNMTCLKVKQDLINILLENYCEIDEQDDIGQSAIYYAIKNSDKKTVQTLINFGANYESIINKIGKTPFDYAIISYKDHLDYYYDQDINKMIDYFCKPFYNSYKDIILSNPNFKNNLINYSKTAFGRILTLTNHKWFTKFYNYSEQWNYNDKKELINLLYKYNTLPGNNQKNKSNGLYIIDTYFNNPDEIISKNEKFHALEYQINKIQKDMQKLTDQNNNLISARNSLAEEIRELNQQLPLDLVRIGNVTNKRNQTILEINRIAIDLGNLQGNLNNLNFNLNQEINALQGNYDLTFTNIRVDPVRLNTTFINQYQDILNELVTNIGEGATQSYNQLWTSYLNNSELLQNVNNIIMLLNQTEIRILNSLQVDSSIPQLNEVLNDLNKIKKYYDSIEEEILSYFHLPNYLDSNPLLNDVYQMIRDTASDIIAGNMELAIKNILFDEFILRIPYSPTIFQNEQAYFNHIFTLLQAVMDRTSNVNNNNETSGSYLRGELNDLVTKDVLNIKRNEQDVSSSDFDGPEEILKRINDLIKLNVGIVIDVEDSKFIDIMNKNIIPYYALNYKLMLPKLKAIFENYLKFIINGKRQLDIVIDILQEKLNNN